MFKNHIKIALRNLKKNKVYSIINIAGLSFGLTCFILIFLYIQDELKYDKYHKNSNRIYRLTWEVPGPVAPKNAITSMAAAPKLKQDFPEIQKIARLKKQSKVTISYNNKLFNEERFFLADPEIFEIFSFEFTKGEQINALKDHYSVIVTETIAKKYFGEENPIGKILLIDNKDVYTVSGVIKDIPFQSHFHVDFIASIDVLGEIKNPFQFWGYTYLLIPENYTPKMFNDKFNDIYGDQEFIFNFKDLQFNIQPVTDIHLRSHLMGELESNSDIIYIYIFSIIAVFILFIACINYMNMATARSSSRSKEVGIRKVVGSDRLQLIKQFLNESILISFIALFIALIAVELFLPSFNNLVQKRIKIHYLENYELLLLCVLITFIVGLISGSYPGFFLSSFQPIQVIRGILNTGFSAKTLRRTLVVFQFIIAVGLIACSNIIKNQKSFISNKKLGFEKDSIINLPIRDESLKNKLEAFKSELKNNPNIINVSAANASPFSGGIQHERNKLLSKVYMVDHDYISTMGMEIIDGRDFSREHTSDTAACFIINESLAKLENLDDPIGKTTRTGYGKIVNGKYVFEGEIIGVIKDFHNGSLYEPIRPMIFQIDPKFYRNFYIKIRPENTFQALKFIEKKYKEFVPYQPFEFSFLNDEYYRLYQADYRFGKILDHFTFLAIFISCLGLFGLISFTSEQRTKEIGIRKVLGASVNNIVSLLSKEYIILVAISNIIAWPAAYYVMNKWLQNFVYHIKMTIFTFILSALIALIIALFTVSFQAVKAAIANPVNSLRQE